MTALALLSGRVVSQPNYVKKCAVATLGVRGGAQAEFWAIRAYPPLMSELLALTVDDAIAVTGEVQITMSERHGQPIVARGLIVRQLLRLPSLAAAVDEKIALPPRKSYVRDSL